MRLHGNDTSNSRYTYRSTDQTQKTAEFSLSSILDTQIFNRRVLDRQLFYPSSDMGALSNS